MTDHILNAELCAKCQARKVCLAITPDGEWNPYIGKNPCPAVLQKPRDDAPAAITKQPWDDCAVPYVVRFRLVLSDIIDGNGGTADIDEYKRLWEVHMNEVQG